MQPANAPSPQIDDVFRALSDPTRRAIVERLAERSASVSELAAPFNMSLPAIYQHLQILRDSGLIQTVKAGRIRNCRLEPRVLRRAEDWLSERARAVGAPPRRANVLRTLRLAVDVSAHQL
jgi:DNA-binding transcriptional ArsR family regulator